MSSSGQNPTVYVTGIGRVPVCKRCHQLRTECRCRETSAASVRQDGFIYVARDRKGRHGKTVTTVAGMPGDTAALAEATQKLKKLCGSGGTVKDLVIQIQGDHRDRIETWLVEQGYRVKRAGG